MPKRITIDINIMFGIIIKMIAGLILFWFILVCFEMI
jgi:tetrahydromethanopterin S-methyltransferase subunit G